ncbi:DHHC palmitoyltransferase-domain-containing protein [Schizophyllum amplum]|uniref:Palmitoyltransferase n=1 Tax=Schizophyllum amplum TaxID=97359 RepID=A0A550CQ09_9AGAR|nr:DHHC palmitoyltransferase-domain-containing protein [Auriculariopsis ampla]
MGFCSGQVFRCFKTLERLGDKVTGFAGPWFVGLAWLLILYGVLCFLDVVLPTLSAKVITVPICVLLIANVLGNYYWACRIRPGMVGIEQPKRSAWLYAKKKRGDPTMRRNFQLTPAKWTGCKRCQRNRPERAHHCRICGTCVLKYDHHWINQCVGINNERYFILFMTYLVVASAVFSYAAWDAVLIALGVTLRPFESKVVSQTLFVLIYILAAVLSLCVGVMLAYHLHLVCSGETTVEAMDFAEYRKKRFFDNSYHLGWRTNLKLFFNVGACGEYPWYTLLLPLIVEPYTNGYEWARKPGCERGHLGIEPGEELTDEDEDL